MRFEVSEKIIAKNATPELYEWCRSNLVLDNPDYYKRERMGKWCGNTPEKIFLFEKIGNDIILPFGCASSLISAFGGYRFYSRIHEPMKFDYGSCMSLYGYQEDAVGSALLAKNGVIVMPCGAGKTQVGLELVSRLGYRALWITHTQDLMNQSMSRARSVLSCPMSSYGTITGGRVNVGSGLTFSTVQTLSKVDALSYRDVWDVVVVDECHKAIGSPTKVMQFYKVLSNISCRYKFGLTATPKRADGLEKSMFALLGDVIHEVSRDDVSSTTCPVMVQQIRTGYVPDMDMALSGDGTINYAGLIKDLTQDRLRFHDVFSRVRQISADGPTLVLANRVEYLSKMANDLTGVGCKCVCLSAMGNSKAARAARKEALGRLNRKELDCVLATYQLAKEGLDVPNLRYVVFATPEKDETTVMQSSGRVGRKADGKKFGTIIDFVDDFGMYQGWARKRLSVYKKLGYKILT